jgi:hypothetical protein
MNEQHEHDDEMVCVHVAVFFAVVLGVIIFLGIIN